MKNTTKMWHPKSKSGEPIIVINSQILNMKLSGWLLKKPAAKKINQPTKTEG